MGRGACSNSPSGNRLAENFAGTANLSWHFAQQGGKVCPVDWERNRHSPRIPTQKFNLLLDSDRHSLRNHLDSFKPTFMFLATPCGTFSRAREKPLSKRSRLMNPSTAPRPLRDDVYPLGFLRGIYPEGVFPQLTEMETTRVEAGNTLVDETLALVGWCKQRNIGWAVENPANSLLWQVPRMKELLQASGSLQVIFHVCMHGGSRDKRTRLVTSCPNLLRLEAKCDNRHQHKPWGFSNSTKAFATSDEAGFPDVLCQRMSTHIMSSASTSPSPPVPDVDLTTRTRAAVGIQNKNMLEQPVPEFHLEFVKQVPRHLANQLANGKVLAKETFLEDRHFPVGTRAFFAPWEKGARGGGRRW